MQPLKVTVESLCCENVKLYVADESLKFMLQELQQQKPYLSNQLFEKLTDNIKDRRNTYSGVLQYLYDPNNSNKNEFEIFNSMSKREVKKVSVT